MMLATQTLPRSESRVTRSPDWLVSWKGRTWLMIGRRGAGLPKKYAVAINAAAMMTPTGRYFRFECGDGCMIGNRETLKRRDAHQIADFGSTTRLPERAREADSPATRFLLKRPTAAACTPSGFACYPFIVLRGTDNIHKALSHTGVAVSTQLSAIDLIPAHLQRSEVSRNS